MKEIDSVSLALEAPISRLMQAAQRGDIHQAESLLHVVSADVRDHTGRTALSWVASRAQAHSPTIRDRAEQLMQFLLDKGADPTLADLHGETPLHWAAKAGDHQMVDAFLQKDLIPPDLVDNRGRTPLSHAAGEGHHRVVELLLATDRVDPDRKDARGRTALSWAAEHWHFKTVTVLIENDSNVDLHDDEGQTPLGWFITSTSKKHGVDPNPRMAQVDFQRWFKALGPTNGTEPMTRTRRTFLSWACERGDSQLVERLLQTTWADPNSIDRYRKTPLIYTIEQSHYEIVDLLIAGTERSQKRDIVSLRIMIQEGRARLLKPFLERYKPSLETEDDYSSVPLMRIALQQSDRVTVTVLLEHKASIQDLENGDWFGPCSAHRPNTDLLRSQFDFSAKSNNLGARNGATSVPVMKMAIPDDDRPVLTALLNHRARIMDLQEDEDDFAQYNKGTEPSIAVKIVALRDGRRKAHWILGDDLDEEVRNIPKTTEETHLILFRENYVWRTHYQNGHQPNELRFSLGNRSPCRTFTLSIQMNLKMANEHTNKHDDQNSDGNEEYSTRLIQWSVLEAPTKSIHYFSNLPYGYIPQNDMDLVQLFLHTWRKDWMTYCQDARRHLAQLRSHQLTARGKDELLIDTVAENMLRWTRIQGTLAEQLNQAREFVSQYQRFSETRQFSEQINRTIDSLEREVSNQIDKLEQTFRDLLQIEFAWTSINEAHRSTSLATSMKRLSWITFIFLPLTFASSLFGMNVDILADNPSWRWYPLVGGTLLLLTVATWLVSKFTHMDRWVESKAQRLKEKSDLVPQR
ncbi:ankyrin [Aspergillus steynii IBT 23096]|uniref:Ankyrin n=1 Tax=Aspergillus steynii IBT 23096 TaxID=1392250 RepID=A0A2I2FSN9_9EURO|nr:ankyrin [Aspergillus steynii IBT 23096]PLB43650.1 ankyrin [Aspergillus steynii IBT 23096]